MEFIKNLDSKVPNKIQIIKQSQYSVRFESQLKYVFHYDANQCSSRMHQTNIAGRLIRPGINNVVAKNVRI